MVSFRAFAAAFLLLQTSPEPHTAVTCLGSAWNAHDAGASRMCYAPSAVAVRNDSRHAIDWEAEEGYRAFDAVVGSVFRFTVLATRGDTVDTELTERNDFLDALGIPLVRARWRYVVRRGLIAEEHHLVADSTFAGVYRRFSAWARTERATEWATISGSSGLARFDGGSAGTLTKLAREWKQSQ